MMMKNESCDFQVATLNSIVLDNELNQAFNIQMTRNNEDMPINLNQLWADLSFIGNSKEEELVKHNLFMKEQPLNSEEDSIRVSYNESLSLSEDLDSYCSSDVEVMPLWLVKELSKVKNSENMHADFQNEAFLNACEAEVDDPFLYEDSLWSDEGLALESTTLRQVNLISECSESLGNKSMIYAPINYNQISPTQIFMKQSSDDMYKPSDTLKDGENENMDKGDSENIQRSSIPESENSINKPNLNEQVVDSNSHRNMRERKRVTKNLKKTLNELEIKDNGLISESSSNNNCNMRKRTKLMSSGDSSSKNTLNLATRRDVVNKTILRVLRRYLTCKFKNKIEQIYEGKPDKQTKLYFYNDVLNLAVMMFGERHPQIKLLHFYLASVIDHKYITEDDVEAAGLEIDDLKTFYNWLYKYSHTRMVNLLQIEPIGKIYEKFYEEAKDEVLQNEVSLSKNKQLYSKVMDEFIQVYRGELDISSLVI